MDKLKPCPFCGVIPVLYCDLTDWRGIPRYKPNEKGYRPTSYVLQAEHKKQCYIRGMDGMNLSGRSTASNWQCLVEWWNRRADNGES